MSQKDYFEISKNENSPIICNVPHSSIFIPKEFLDDYVLGFDELQRETKYMADSYINIIFSELLNFSSFIKLNISRIVLDIERFKNEEDEPMSKVGMSAIYTKTSNGDLLREIKEENKEKLLEIYDDYHNNFTELVENSLQKNDFALIVDCHSFPSKVRIYDQDKNEHRPDICIGIDDFHTPKVLQDLLENNFKNSGFSVEINSPFSGTIVPIYYYKKNNKVISVMIEINRKIYMNEENFEADEDINNIGRKISRTIMKSIDEFLETYGK